MLDNKVSDEKQDYEQLLSIIGCVRKDIYAKRALKADEQGKFDYFKGEGVLTEDDLHRHLNGGPSIAVYPLLDGGTVKVAVYDLDDHDGTFGFDKLCAIAQRLLALARDHGLVGWPVRSGGGAGVHIWFFWDTPQSAPQIRQVLGDILVSAGLTEGAAGVAKDQVEIFPSSGIDSIGTAIALPFSRKSVPLDDNLATVDIQPMWTTSAPIDVEIRAAPTRNASYALPPFGDVLAALEIIPNDDLDYESWWKVLAATAASTGKSEEGLDAFLIWSRQSTKHVEATSRKKWSSAKEDKSGFGALINLARRYQDGWQPPSWLGVAPYSEQWLALRFVAENVATARYTAEVNQWCHWDGNRWAKDKTLKALSMAQEICRRAAREKNKGSKVLLKATTRAAVVALARENPLLATTTKQWDADPWLLGTPGGVVDLRTGKLHAGESGYMITMSTACAPGGGCPLWIKTVGEIFNGDEAFIGYVQRLLGYCLTGSVQEEKFVFSYGGGRNGKGTFWETVRYVLGDYAGTVALATLLAMKQHGHDTEIMVFKGKRLMVANEPNDTDRLDSARIKLFTGGDQMTGRYMRCDPIAFDPTHKLVISGNHPPRFGQVDTALEERINVLGFNVFFDEGKRDLTLKARLRDESAGILAWCIAGCLEWQQQGLNPPRSVRVQSAQMMKEASDLAVFIDEMCEPGGESTKVPEIFDQWSRWQLRRGRDPGTKKAFTKDLVNAGYVVTQGHARTAYVQGLLLLNPMWPDF